jgi:hypothetical protein
MSKLTAFLIINGAFVWANVVAAGVFGLLGDIAKRTVPDIEVTTWPWILIGIVSAGSAFLFMAGLLATGKSMLKTLR